MEMLPWDVWGMMPRPDDELGGEEIVLLDRVAELTLAGGDGLSKLWEIYRDERLRVPKMVFNADRQAQETIGI